MNCKKCGSQLTENDQFCKGCGAAVERVSAQNMNVNNFNTQSQQPMNNGYQQPVNNGINGQTMNQTWTNSYNQPTYNQGTKNNGNAKFIIIGIIIAIAIFGGILTVGLLSNKNDNSLDNDGNMQQANNSSNYKVNFGGFAFKIPTDLVYETDSDAMLLSDENGTWAAYIEVVEGSYNQLLNNKNQLQSIYLDLGYNASSVVEKTIGGMSFITLELSMGGTNALLGLAKANSMYVFGVTALNLDNEFDYDLLKTISKVLNSAEYTGETNNMQINNKIDLSGISSLAK